MYPTATSPLFVIRVLKYQIAGNTLMSSTVPTAKHEEVFCHIVIAHAGCTKQSPGPTWTDDNPINNQVLGWEQVVRYLDSVATMTDAK